MKTLHLPEPCQVILDPKAAPGGPGSLLEPDGDDTGFVSAVLFRQQTWRTRVTLEVWTYWGDWWLDPKLEGESRRYFVLGTQRGEISVFYRSSPSESERGWFVAGWFD